MEARRRQSRFMCAELARVNWMIGQEAFQTEDAILEDISVLGGCVQLEQAIPVGSVIMLTFRGERFNGRVRYCVAGEFGYFVGVKFAAEDMWSRERALPAHLTATYEAAAEPPYRSESIL